MLTAKSNTNPTGDHRPAASLRCLFPVMLFILSSFFLQAQNISGIVNTYFRVVEVIPSRSCVRLNVTGGLALNDRVLLVQMKGASVNTDPASAAFGDTSSLNHAGNYEMNTVCYVVGDSVFLVYKILNQYTVADKVQLVRVPEYTDAIVTDTLKPAPWNNTAGTGGVLALFVTQDLTLNAPIYADSSGYRGGAFRISGSSCNNSPGANLYGYPGAASPTQNGAYKGEGIADLAVAINGGRGAAANAGGGGNNHNNGGAGGANLSAGGDGGGNSSAGTFNCRLAFQGRGGKALSNHGGKKIFAGGGGGAGHVNNGYIISHGGGNGGGIIFVHAANLIGNGFSISANGQVGGGAASDGAAGGGAGGTVIMDVANYTGVTLIRANGGQGGTEADGGNINYCYGAGGGGSGGAIYFAGTTPPAPVTTTVTGGAAGPETGRDASCNPIVSSAAGADGQIIQSYVYRRSTQLAGGYCSVLLPLEFTQFQALYFNQQTQLIWKTSTPNEVVKFEVQRSPTESDWTVLATIVPSENNLEYNAADPTPPEGVNYYRIKTTKRSGAVTYSISRLIFVPSGVESFNVYPNPAQEELWVTGIGRAGSVELVDMTGRIILLRKFSGVQTAIRLQLPPLPPGVYFVRVDAMVKRVVIR